MATSDLAGTPARRPAVAVVVPFYGDADDGRSLLGALRRLRLGPDDEVVVADNTEDGRLPPATERVHVVRAPLERSSYYARNLGAEHTTASWLLFVDSDTRPSPDILDAYFAEPIPDAVGIVSGSVVAAGDQTALVARYAASRRHIDPSHYRRQDRRPAGITANLLVRRRAWEAVGGFHEGIRSGADLEFCWRVQDAGWRLAWRPEAAVEHLHVDTVGALVRKAVRHAGGGSWVNRRYGGAFGRPPVLRGMARATAGVLVWGAARHPERALFKAIDGLFLAADGWGRLTGNRAARDTADLGPVGTVVLLDRFPEPDRARPDAPADARFEVRARPWRPDHRVRRALHVTYLEDEGALAQMRALAWAIARRPSALRTARELRGTGWSLRDVAAVARRAAARRPAPAVAAGDDASRAAARLVAAILGAGADRPQAGR